MRAAAVPHVAIRDRAVALLPRWQAGYIALSHALHASGEREASREVLDEALQFPADDENAVGWWSYEVGLSQRLEPLELLEPLGFAGGFGDRPPGSPTPR